MKNNVQVRVEKFLKKNHSYIQERRKENLNFTIKNIKNVMHGWMKVPLACAYPTGGNKKNFILSRASVTSKSKCKPENKCTEITQKR